MDGRVLVFSSTQAPEANITEQETGQVAPTGAVPKPWPYLGLPTTSCGYLGRH